MPKFTPDPTDAAATRLNATSPSADIETIVSYYGLWAEDVTAAMSWLRSLRPDEQGHLVRIVLPCCPSVTYFIDNAHAVPHESLACPHGNFYVVYGKRT